MNQLSRIESVFKGKPESSVHPHDPAELAELFSAADGSSVEFEVLYFLGALVHLFKPRNVLETGTGEGLATIAIASALSTNDRGILTTVEIDGAKVERARANLLRVDAPLGGLVVFNTGDSRELIEKWTGAPFDFAFFDSLIAFRHLEFELLLSRKLLTEDAVCVFHDTSRRRGGYFSDYNPEMIAALDRHSQGRQWLESPLSRGLRVLKLG